MAAAAARAAGPWRRLADSGRRARLIASPACCSDTNRRHASTSAIAHLICWPDGRPAKAKGAQGGPGSLGGHYAHAHLWGEVRVKAAPGAAGAARRGAGGRLFVYPVSVLLFNVLALLLAAKEAPPRRASPQAHVRAAAAPRGLRLPRRWAGMACVDAKESHGGPRYQMGEAGSTLVMVARPARTAALGARPK